ncbi:MAG: diaminopimelate epimerase [Candidatus Omnitrophica bacterium]|nr:diaminopimelate epimerase [Candidatus Omnitrophota bacterium]
MKKIDFVKMQASGNDFILIDRRLKPGAANINYKSFAKKYCERKISIGADGLLVIESSGKAEFKMRIFNADGSEAKMCGNGARCVAFWAFARLKKTNLSFETKAGIIEAKLIKGEVSIKMTKPRGLKFGIPLEISGKNIKVNFINTGVPHTVIFVEGLKNIDVDNLGRQVRFHKKFSPAGTNVDFIESLGFETIRIRTYERGVEAETLACGTGSAASAIVADCILRPETKDSCRQINVITKSGEALSVFFKRKAGRINDIWLKGKAAIVCSGQISQ